MNFQMQTVFYSTFGQLQPHPTLVTPNAEFVLPSNTDQVQNEDRNLKQIEPIIGSLVATKTRKVSTYAFRQLKPVLSDNHVKTVHDAPVESSFVYDATV